MAYSIKTHNFKYYTKKRNGNGISGTILGLLYLPCDVHVHVTRSQLELKRARCKISNKGYLSLNIFVILCHNMVSEVGFEPTPAFTDYQTKAQEA